MILGWMLVGLVALVFIDVPIASLWASLPSLPCWPPPGSP